MKIYLRLVALGVVLIAMQSVTLAQSVVKPVREDKINLFSLEDVRVTDPQFKHIQDLDQEYLLNLDVDRLLSWFRREAGLQPKSQPYPSWESEGGSPLSGHILGFYMSSMSMMYQSTGDERIRDRLVYIVSELKACQDAVGSGFLAAQNKVSKIYDIILTGNYNVDGGMINRYFEPVYILNKIMLGLYDIYAFAHVEEAKPVLIKLADWFGTSIVDKLDHALLQKLLICEHGSINESYINVYEITGDVKYLNWAKRLNDDRMWIPLSEGKDILKGWHANTQIPKFTGFNCVGKYTGDEKMTNAANFFWDIVVSQHTWVMGGNSCGEHFFSKEDFQNRVRDFGGPESCNSVNMMRLTENLYQSNPKMERVDFYENVLFNHILANYEPEQGMPVYYTSMRPGHYKKHATPFTCFYCCAGTGLEAPAKFGKMIYAYKDANLYVNMFLASELNWKEQGVKLTQFTKYPNENNSTLTVQTDKDKEFTLKIRSPRWIESGSLKITVNGTAVENTVVEEGYVSIARKWSNGDTVAIAFEPKFEVEPLKDVHRFYSVKYGAIVLATRMPSTNITRPEYSHAYSTVGHTFVAISDAPTLFGTPDEIAKTFKRVPGSELKFTYSGLNSQTSEMIPFNQIHFDRYAVYFNHAQDMEDYRNNVQYNTWEKDPALLSKTLQYVIIGNPNSEGPLHYRQDGNIMLAPLDLHLSWRRAFSGWFSYDFAVPQGDIKPALNFTLRVTDKDQAGVDVYVNDKLVWSMEQTYKTTKIVSTRFYTQTVAIPEDAYKGKDKLTVKFVAKPGVMTGDVMDIRIVKE